MISIGMGSPFELMSFRVSSRLVPAVDLNKLVIIIENGGYYPWDDGSRGMRILEKSPLTWMCEEGEEDEDLDL